MSEENEASLDSEGFKAIIARPRLIEISPSTRIVVLGILLPYPAVLLEMHKTTDWALCSMVLN